MFMNTPSPFDIGSPGAASELAKLCVCAVSAAVYAFGMNMFVVSCGMYCGGMLGVCQIAADCALRLLGLNVGFDAASLLYFAINLPLLIYAARRINKRFLLRTAVAVGAMTAAFAALPVRAVLPGDRLTSCIVGGIVCGAANGMVLRMGGCGGGFDIVGMILTQSRGNASVGKLTVAVNVVFFALCISAYDISVVIYSLIFVAIYSAVLDRSHLQNIAVEAIIITRASKEIEKAVIGALHRDATRWSCVGSYSNRDEEALCVVLSKHELPKLRQIIKQHDENAFVIYNENVSITGNFPKHL